MTDLLTLEYYGIFSIKQFHNNTVWQSENGYHNKYQ